MACLTSEYGKKCDKMNEKWFKVPHFFLLYATFTIIIAVVIEFW